MICLKMHSSLSRLFTKSQCLTPNHLHNELNSDQLTLINANITTQRHQRSYTCYPRKPPPRITPQQPTPSTSRWEIPTVGKPPPGLTQEVLENQKGEYVILMEINTDEAEELKQNTPPFRKTTPNRWAGRASVAQGNSKRGKNKYAGRTGVRFFDEN